MKQPPLPFRLFTMASALLLIVPATAQETPAADFGGIDFGDDAGNFANDGECDDMRFAGDGMTETPLIADDLYHDASDCRAAFAKGTIALAPLFMRLAGEAEIVWGDDEGEFSRDGECDDLRFEGPGMTTTPLIPEDIGHDATDCRAAYKDGKIIWRNGPISRIEAETILV